MKILNIVFALSLFSFSCGVPLKAYAASAECQNCFHLDEDEDFDEDLDDQSHWYDEYRPNPLAFEKESPTTQLDKDTSWPNQREEFSDTLFR